MNIAKEKIIGRFFDSEEDNRELMETWNESLKSFPKAHDIPFIQDDFIRKYGKLGALSDDSIKTVINDKNCLIEDEELLIFLWHCVNFIYNSNDRRKQRGAIPQLDKTLPKLYHNFFILLVLAGYPSAVKYYEAKALPKQVMNDTLQDLNIWVEQYQRELGVTGLTQRIFGWMQGHMNGGLFKIGRLQFQYPYVFGEGVMVLKHNTTGKLQLLSDPDIRYNRSGLIDGVNDIWDETGQWVSTVQETSSVIIANPINAAGYAEQQQIELEFKEWDKVLTKGDNVLNIHIPAGEPMTPEACIESFNQAKNFFPKYFPDYNFRAFVCFSWLLDNQFEHILKPTSNIIKFQHLGQIWSIGGKSEAIYRVFGHQAREAGIDAVPHTSSMQRLIAEFIRSGGILRNGGFVRF